jgi:4,5-dihydroxyphthalate decarboxylase
MADTDRELLLRTVTRTQGANAALKDGGVEPKGFRFDFEEVPVLVQGFRRMVRGLEFDVSEMALTTYLVAKAHGARFTALPVFLVRGFHHGAIRYDPRSSEVRGPADLARRRVGVNRGYTVTTGVWARSVLAEEHGVDLDGITWVCSGDEHVGAYRPPANVVSEPGADLVERVLSGELAAVVGAGADDPRLAPLIPDPEEAGLAALRSRGHYPINHLVVVRDELLEREPWLAPEIFDTFARAKRRYVERLRAGAIESPSRSDRLLRRVMEATGGRDPLPYGVEPNRAVLAELQRHAVAQHILDRPLPLTELFAAGTLDLSA